MKTKDISLGLLLFAAGTCASCGATDMKRCVDKDNIVVSDDKCAGVAEGYGGGGYHPYYWYYGGTGYHGAKASGGYTHPAKGTSYSTASSKGGFGGSAGVHGAGGGHGGSAVAT